MENVNIVCCERCGQVINEVVVIDNKSYGTTCALTVLGIRDFPHWFKGGDYSKAKLKNDEYLKKLEEDIKIREEITRDTWEERRLISIALYREYSKNDNSWLYKFLTSICEQLNIRLIAYEVTNFETYDEAKNNWSNAYGDISSLLASKETKQISDLSSKQRAIVYKNI